MDKDTRTLECNVCDTRVEVHGLDVPYRCSCGNLGCWTEVSESEIYTANEIKESIND